MDARLFQDLRVSGLPLDTVTYNAVLAACEVGRDWQRALNIYSEMKSAGAARLQVNPCSAPQLLRHRFLVPLGHTSSSPGAQNVCLMRAQHQR